MKRLLTVLATMAISSQVFAASIDPKATSFPVMNDKGTVYNMADHPNSVFVLEAYSINCVYCGQNAANIKKIYNHFKDDGQVEVLDLGLDSRDYDYNRWVSRHNPPYPVVKDVGRRVWNQLRQANGIPQMFVVNCHGQLVHHHVGLMNSSGLQQAISAISTATQTKCE